MLAAIGDLALERLVDDLEDLDFDWDFVWVLVTFFFFVVFFLVLFFLLVVPERLRFVLVPEVALLERFAPVDFFPSAADFLAEAFAAVDPVAPRPLATASIRPSSAAGPDARPFRAYG